MTKRQEGVLQRIERRLRLLEKRVAANHEEMRKRTVLIVMEKRPKSGPLGPPPKKRAR